MTDDAFLDSLQVLEEHGYVDVHRTFGSVIESAGSFNVTTLGLDLYAHSYIEDYDAMLTKVAVELVNGELRSDRQIAAETGVPRVIVDHVFDVFESQDLLRVSKMTGPNSHVHSISPRLGRMIQGGP